MLVRMRTGSFFGEKQGGQRSFESMTCFLRMRTYLNTCSGHSILQHEQVNKIPFTSHAQHVNVCAFALLHRTGEDFMNVGTSVSVTYTSGEWSGYLVADKVGFGDFSMDKSNFALITSSTAFFIAGADWAGILGLGYRSLAKV